MAFWKQIPEQNIGHFLSGCNFPYCNNGFFPSFQTHFSSLTLSLLSALTLLRRRNCFSGNCTLMMQFSEQKLFESLQIIFLLLNFYLHLRMSSVRFCCGSTLTILKINELHIEPFKWRQLMLSYEAVQDFSTLSKLQFLTVIELYKNG